MAKGDFNSVERRMIQSLDRASKLVSANRKPANRTERTKVRVWSPATASQPLPNRPPYSLSACPPALLSPQYGSECNNLAVQTATSA